MKYNTSWWLNQPIWKICSSNWITSPIFGVKIKKICELPPPRICIHQVQQLLAPSPNSTLQIQHTHLAGHTPRVAKISCLYKRDYIEPRSWFPVGVKWSVGWRVCESWCFLCWKIVKNAITPQKRMGLEDDPVLFKCSLFRKHVNSRGVYWIWDCCFWVRVISEIRDSALRVVTCCQVAGDLDCNWMISISPASNYLHRTLSNSKFCNATCRRRGTTHQDNPIISNNVMYDSESTHEKWPKISIKINNQKNECN